MSIYFLYMFEKYSRRRLKNEGSLPERTPFER
jgi:hypothetical protein